MPGLELIEMDNNKEKGLCCGGGGGVWSKYPGDQRFGVLRINEALNTGSDVIATACPYCIRMLNEAIVELGVVDKIIVRDITELLLQSVDFLDKQVKADNNKSLDQEEFHV